MIHRHCRQDIRDYLDAENSYYTALMDDTTGLQETLFEELKGRHQAGRFLCSLPGWSLCLCQPL